MRQCQDCIHKAVCKIEIRPSEFMSFKCSYFKDQNVFFELPKTLKKGSKLYYFFDDLLSGRAQICRLPDIVTAIMREGFYASPRTNSDGTFNPDSDQFYYWDSIGTEYFLTREEAEQALKEWKGE